MWALFFWLRKFVEFRSGRGKWTRCSSTPFAPCVLDYRLCRLFESVCQQNLQHKPQYSLKFWEVGTLGCYSITVADVSATSSHLCHQPEDTGYARNMLRKNKENMGTSNETRKTMLQQNAFSNNVRYQKVQDRVSSRTFQLLEILQSLSRDSWKFFKETCPSITHSSVSQYGILYWCHL